MMGMSPMQGVNRSTGWRASAKGIGSHAALAFLVACSRGPTRTSGQATRLSATESVALADIALTRGEEVSGLDPTILEIMAESSRVVPGLVYFRSVYKPHGTAHMESVVILAQRGTNLLILRTPEDFTAVSAGWMPDGPDAANTFCNEIAGALGHASASVSRPMVFENADDWRQMGFSPPGPPWRSRVGAPRVTRVGEGQWIVQLWVAEPGRMARYECKLQAGRPPRLEVMDSIPGAGFPPDNP
jgi:hypothetical protein